MKIYYKVTILFLTLLSAVTHSEEPIEISFKSKKAKITWSEGCFSQVKLDFNLISF